MVDNVSLNAVIAAEKIVYSYLKPTQLICYKSLSDMIGADIISLTA